MDSNDFNLGYEEVYNDRLGETKSMITLATLLDSLDQGAEGVRYNAVMRGAYEIAEKANPSGLPSSTPDVTLVSSVIRSNVKLMIYNIIEYSVTNLMQAIYDRVKDEGCGYAEVSEKLQSIWHHTQMYNGLSDPKASNSTAESISCQVIVTGDASVGSIDADALAIRYADGVVTAEGAARIDAYSTTGALVGSARADRLSVDAKGLLIVVATGADGNRTISKIIAK